nr:hypothetical protein [Tanacetum cinerariifolium]
PQVAAKDTDLQKALEESMKTAYALPRGSSGNLNRENIGQLDSEEESEKVVLGTTEGGNDEYQAGPDLGAQAEGQTGIDAGTLNEGQAGSNPDEMFEGQAGPDPGNAGDKEQSIPSLVVHVVSDREHMDLDVADVSPQPFPEQLDERFTATVYPKVQENLKLAVEEEVLLEEPASSSGTLSSLQHLSKDICFGDQLFSDKPSDADKNIETEVESMVNVPIQQVVSSISLMTSPVIDLTSRLMSPRVHQQFKATTTDTTTTTTTLPPPQAQQQSTAEAMMVKCIGKLEHIMANLIQVNKEIEERLDKHGARLFTLEQLDIPQQVSIIVSEVVTDAVDWAMQAPLSLEKSINRDQSEGPSGSPSHQPPPPPPPAGPSGTSGAPRAFGSQVTPHPPPPTSTNQDSPSTGSIAPSPANTAATTKHQAWSMPDVTLQPLVSLTPEDLDMDEAMDPDEQA